MKMKMLVAAVTMAVAGGANAAYVSPTVAGAGTMVFWAYDSTNANNGYVADLGETFGSFGLSHASETWNLSGALSTISAANLVWGVGAGDKSIGGPKTGLYTSLQPTLTGGNTAGANSALTNMDSNFSGLNSDACGTTCATERVGALSWGPKWGTLIASTGGAVGDTMNFFALKSGSSNPAKPTETVYPGKFSFNSAGTLSYTVASSAVPVPAAAWLLGSALVGMVGVARRKREAQA